MFFLFLIIKKASTYKIKHKFITDKILPTISRGGTSLVSGTRGVVITKIKQSCVHSLKWITLKGTEASAMGGKAWRRW